MRKIYTSVELGSYSIKIVVCEIIGNTPHVLAASNTRCKGIKNGIIIDNLQVKESLLNGLTKISDMLGFKIKEVILGVNIKDKFFDIVTEEIKIENEKKLVTEEEIDKIYSEAATNNIAISEQLLTIMPISFQVDKSELTKDPKGMVGKKLILKAVIIKVNKEDLRPYIELFNECGLKIVDISLSSIGDYYEVRNKEFDSGVSVIINIGYNKIDVSIFNKGIMVKSESIYEGSNLVDKDLMHVYGIKKSSARKLKENFAVSNTRYSSVNDIIELVNKEGEEVEVNQLEVSEIVESRIVYLLKIAKKQINILTNREISNIIITGGISELAGFQYVVENIFDHNTSTLDIKDMGIRNNMYSSSIGLIKYFNDKLNLKGIAYSMVSEEDSSSLVQIKDKNNILKDGILSKVFGYFKDE